MVVQSDQPPRTPEDGVIEDARARQRRHRRIGVGAALLVVGVIVLVIIGGGGGHGPGSASTWASVPGGVLQAKTRTFVSLLYVCVPDKSQSARVKGCGPHQTYVENLSLFSLADGRRLGTIASVPNRRSNVATPVGTSDGRILVTVTRSAPCITKGQMECGGLTPDSCRNRVLTLAPGQTVLKPLFTVASKWAIGAAVLSPDGSRVAYTAEPCTGATPEGGVFVRDMRTGQTRAIVSTNFCSTVGQPAWNPSGTQVVFPFQRSTTRAVPGGFPQGGAWWCPPGLGGHATNLAIVSSTTTTPMSSMKLISAGKDCGFESATYDAAGIVALEGCTTQKSAQYPYRGRAYVVQYSHENRLQTRIKLPYPGLAPGMISREPTTGQVLISQDQPEFAHQRYDIVYQLDGSHLREIRRYPWGSEFLPVPW